MKYRKHYTNIVLQYKNTVKLVIKYDYICWRQAYKSNNNNTILKKSNIDLGGPK